MRMEEEKLSVPYTALQKFWMLLGGGILVALLVALLVLWPQIPEQIPGHYNAQGEVTRYDGKGAVWIMPIIGMILYAGLLLLSFFPQAWNTPIHVTRENRLRVLSRTRDMLCWMAVLLSALFSYIGLSMTGLVELGAWFLPVELLLVFGLLIWGVVRVVRAGKPRGPSQERDAR